MMIQFRYAWVLRSEEALARSSEMADLDDRLHGRWPLLSCQSDPDGSRAVTDKIFVSAMGNDADRILCFMMTHSGAHHTNVKAVLGTWGAACDGWVIASNQTDPQLGSLEMHTPAVYTRLWTKLNETLRYVAEHHMGAYDWFFKVDDDTFVLMENLRRFLKTKKTNEEIPQIFGYLLTDQFWGDQRLYFDLSDHNRAFGELFLTKVRKKSDKVNYLAGGSGYIMNRIYLRKLLQALESNLTLHGEVPEDMAQGATMLAHGISPGDSRDSLGREHFIPEPPSLWHVRHQARIRSGIVPANRECCARYAVSFHHISPVLMHHLYDQFYRCRGPSNTI